MEKITLSRLKTCLIADDDDDLREVMHYVVKSLGLKCRTASNGAQAWESIQSAPPDLLITDFNMPPPDGLELLYLCREAGHHFFVILASGRADTVDQQRVALQDCCAAVLQKPFDRRALATCIQAADKHEHVLDCVHTSTASATKNK